MNLRWPWAVKRRPPPVLRLLSLHRPNCLPRPALAGPSPGLARLALVVTAWVRPITPNPPNPRHPNRNHGLGSAEPDSLQKSASDRGHCERGWAWVWGFPPAETTLATCWGALATIRPSEGYWIHPPLAGPHTSCVTPPQRSRVENPDRASPPASHQGTPDLAAALRSRHPHHTTQASLRQGRAWVEVGPREGRGPVGGSTDAGPLTPCEADPAGGGHPG